MCLSSDFTAKDLQVNTDSQPSLSTHHSILYSIQILLFPLLCLPSLFHHPFLPPLLSYHYWNASTSPCLQCVFFHVNFLFVFCSFTLVFWADIDFLPGAKLTACWGFFDGNDGNLRGTIGGVACDKSLQVSSLARYLESLWLLCVFVVLKQFLQWHIHAFVVVYYYE